MAYLFFVKGDKVEISDEYNLTVNEILHMLHEEGDIKKDERTGKFRLAGARWYPDDNEIGENLATLHEGDRVKWERVAGRLAKGDRQGVLPPSKAGNRRDGVLALCVRY